MYVYSHTLMRALGLVNDPERSDMDYVNRGGRQPTVRGLPLLKPPWGRITAIDLNQGEIVWQIAHGETPDRVRNHPALRGLDIPRTGRTGGAGGSSGGIGTLVTKTLVISGEGGVFTTPSGARGAMLRAYDKATGQERGAVEIPAAQTGVADDLHARRQAIPRPGRGREQLSRRDDRVRAATIRAGVAGDHGRPLMLKHGVAPLCTLTILFTLSTSPARPRYRGL